MKKNHGVEISGQTWSKIGSFGSFSKTALTILLVFCQKRAHMVPDVCVKCGLQQKSGSPDIGPFVTPKRLLRRFLEKYQTDLKDFLPEGGHNGTKSWCKI